jgi:hypothetical protein
MEGETCRIVEVLSQKASSAATREVMSVAAGPEEVMTAIPRLRKLTWTKCTDAECLTNPKHQPNLVSTEVSPWNLNSNVLSSQNLKVVAYCLTGHVFE